MTQHHMLAGASGLPPASVERQSGSEPLQEASTSGRADSVADSAGAPAQIGIIMGSDSDLKTMAAAEEVRGCLVRTQVIVHMFTNN